jgi:hypothetical protein
VVGPSATNVIGNPPHVWIHNPCRASNESNAEFNKIGRQT